MHVAAVSRVSIAVVAFLTWDLLDLNPIVVHKLVAGEKTPCVCLEFLVQSVATHGHGTLYVHECVISINISTIDITAMLHTPYYSCKLNYK